MFLDFAQGAGNGVFSHLFSFYLHAGPLTTHFDASRVARDKPWSTLCKKSHGIPSSPHAAAVAKFRLLTGHDCICAHLFRFNLVTSPICVLCDTGQDMTAAHLDECSTLNDLNCIHTSRDLDAVEFWHHENLPSWAGVETATLDVQKASDKRENYATFTAQSTT
ncbi:uncharacterized protein TNCV_658901 [Trichonephila clavipes]|nr:uncharacterized protein TNCV_658901 [Trichonephila clavipes]